MLQKIALHQKKKNKGFTLVELVVVIAILAILAAIAVPQLLGFQTRAKEQADRQSAAQIKNAFALLYANNEAVPPADATFNVDGAVGTIDITNYASGELQKIVAGTKTDLTEVQAETLLTELVKDLDIKSASKTIEVKITTTGAVSADLK